MMSLLKTRVAVLLCACLMLATWASAQSTFGVILGTVKDNSGATVPNAKITITNTDENTTRDVVSNSNGDFEAVNTKPGHYQIEATAPGFQTSTATGLLLVARQTLRVDVTLQLGQVSQSVTVEAGAGVIATDTQTISSSINSGELMSLPANTRASDSTSPYNLIATLPGVQSDNNGNFTIQGNLPSQTQYSVDGISTTDVTGNGPQRKAFTSTEMIAEMKVQAVGNNAEYGQSGDVTTISKSGTNAAHGSVFWYSQNRAFDANRYGAITKPQKVANDLGVSGGGPVMIPKIYNGKDKTFFFGDFERFTFPRGETIQNRVPTEAMRNGDFSHENVTLKDPFTGDPYPNNIIPTSKFNDASNKILSLYPLPNAGDLTTVHDANYIDNRDNGYNSNQYDIRIDHYLTSKQSIYGRWTWLNTDTMKPTQLLLPSVKNLEKNRMFVVSHNYTILPNLLNEARFGFTNFDSTNGMDFDGPAFADSLGLVGLGPKYPFNGLPEINFNNLESENIDRVDGFSKSHTYQGTDNLTWTHGRHTMKFGADIRRMRAGSDLGFIGANNYGNFDFTGNFTGAPFADFLLGIPHSTSYAIVKNDNDGITTHYAYYAQDSFRVSQRLTLEYGLRYEYHPSYQDTGGNIGNFDPSVPKSGRVIYPTGKEANLAPGYLKSFNACPELGSAEGPSYNGAPCTPVLSAKQAGIPEGLRFVPKLRFLPRFGFAYRPFGDDKTVIRGGFGVYNVVVLGSVFYSLTGTLQADARQFNNFDTQGRPTVIWPQISPGGSGIVADDLGNAYFGTANAIHFKDPYSFQYNLSIEREIGQATGLRLSFISQRTYSLVWAENYNQSYYSTDFYIQQPLSSRPFPNWGEVNTRDTGASAFYNAGQVEVNHRLRGGLQLNSTYTFANNMADNQGPNPSGFAGETAGGRTMDAYNRRAEYGPVYATRRHRWLTTAVYELPFGRGRQFGSNSNAVVDAVLGGWRLSSIFLWQSGPFMTPTFSDGDPSGTGSGFQRTQHPDRVSDGNLSNPTRDHWIDTGAFTCPGTPGWEPGTACTIGVTPGQDLAPIGRFGNSGLGVIKGPGTINLSMGLAKTFSITERFKLKLEGTFTNLPNHPNLADPQMAIDSNSFGQITKARASEFGGSRTGEVGVRIEF
jgi:hypothetical protein